MKLSSLRRTFLIAIFRVFLPGWARGSGRSLAGRLERKFLSLVFGMLNPGDHVTFLRFRGLGYALHTYGHADIVSHLIWHGGIWEPAVAELIHALCSKPGTTFVDIGSNLGTHTCIAELAGRKADL